MKKHTSGPFYVGAQNDALFIVVGRPPALNNDYPNHTADRTAIAKVYDDSNAERIVACMNAMEGIDDPAAARAILDDPRTSAATDMLQALKLCLADAQSIGGTNLSLEAFDAIHSAIAKAEGKDK